VEQCADQLQTLQVTEPQEDAASNETNASEKQQKVTMRVSNS
jgi:hypothetical protein